MKIFLGLFIVTILISTNIYAIECPKLTLECEHKVLNSKGYYEVVEKQSTNFIGINDDEPSLPPIECVASILFTIGQASNSLNITVKEDLNAFLYFGIKNGAAYPQFETSAIANKPMTLTINKELMTCVLK
jgi:hypothetical protein